MKRWRVTAPSLLGCIVLVLSACTRAQRPSIAVASPAEHAMWAVDVRTGVVPAIRVELVIRNFEVPNDGAVHLTGEKIGEYTDGFLHSSPSPVITLLNIGRGSQFWTFTLVHTNGSAVAGVPPAVLHMEVVVAQNTDLPRWQYTPSETERRPKILFNLPHVRRPRNDSDESTRQRICFVASTKGLFDGQKKIWLQAIAALPRPRWGVKVLSFEHFVGASPFSEGLDRLNVSIENIPLEITYEALAAHELLPTQAMPAIIEAFDREFSAMRYTVSMTSFKQRASNLFPPFASSIWRRVVSAMHSSCHGAVLVVGNARDVSDRLLVTAARVAGVRAVVMELTSVEPTPLELDVLVAPSHYALRHPSVVDAVAARQRYVLSTGVNTDIFRPAHSRHVDDHSGVFTVGYIGRLSTDKSVGLLVSAARLLVTRCPRDCKIRIIGDGPLRGELESLVDEWGLRDVVQLTGGIYSEPALARELQGLDVFVSTRFDETLGIAPLEAMSCGVPVVGFASGGVSEYLEHGVNGIAVRDPSPNAMVDAILTVRGDGYLRQRLSENARRTVLERFSLRVGVTQYVTLYERLAEA